MNEPMISEAISALTKAEIKEEIKNGLPAAVVVIVLSLIFSLLIYPVSMIFAAFGRDFGLPEIPNWVYTALFLGIVLWLIRGQRSHIPTLGPVAWLVLIMMVSLPVVICIFLPDWAILPSILVVLTPLYLFARLLEAGRKKIETGEV